MPEKAPNWFRLNLLTGPYFDQVLMAALGASKDKGSFQLLAHLLVAHGAADAVVHLGIAASIRRHASSPA